MLPIFGMAALLATQAAAGPGTTTGPGPARAEYLQVQASGAPFVPECQIYQNRAARARCIQIALSHFGYPAYGPSYGPYGEGSYGYAPPAYGYGYARPPYSYGGYGGY
jgi:hypothetical protein